MKTAQRDKFPPVLRILYIIWQCIWGYQQTLIGLIIYLIYYSCPHSVYRGAVVTYWKSIYGLSLGLFVFMPRSCMPNPGHSEKAAKALGNRTVVKDCDAPVPPPLLPDNPLLVHEYGHTIQSLILGPYYLLLIGLPSMLWLRLPVFQKLRNRKHISYYSFYTEKWADFCGEKITGQESMH